MDATQVNPNVSPGYPSNPIYPNWNAWPAVDNIDTAKFTGGAFPGVPNLVIGANGDTTDQSQPCYVRYVTDAIANGGASAECIRWRHNNYANFLFCDGHVGQFYCNPKNLDSSGSIFNGHYVSNLMRRNVWLPYMP
jgi:prepilin-type processing-associated H-X9-DG protein